MTDDLFFLEGEPIVPFDSEPWIDAAEKLERLAERVRTDDVKAVGVHFVEIQAGCPQVVFDGFFASGQCYSAAAATALRDHRFCQHVCNG